MWNDFVGWMFKVKLSDPAELEDMMDQAAYKEFVDSSEWIYTTEM